jgi:hypothetical protein
LDRFPAGAWWVELAPLAEERLVPGVAVTLAVEMVGGRVRE